MRSSALPLFGEPALAPRHQSQLEPTANKFHVGNGEDGKHYWLYPPKRLAELNAEFDFTTDVCPWLGRPWREGDWDGLTAEWGERNWCNPPFGSIIHQGKKKGPTAWMRKAIEERRKGKLSVIVYPLDKWVLMMAREILGEHADIRNEGDVKFCATEDGSEGKGTGRHIGLFVLRPDGLKSALVPEAIFPPENKSPAALALEADQSDPSGTLNTNGESK